MSKLKLTVELVPKSAWFQNVRSEFTKPQWDMIRRRSYRLANHRCQICGCNPDVLECHETWRWDADAMTQILTGFIALCPDCHKVKHAGLWINKGFKNLVIEHLAIVNSITAKEAELHVLESFITWRKNSEDPTKWKLDISYAHEYLNTSIAESNMKL